MLLHLSANTEYNSTGNIVERKIYLDLVFYALGHCGLTTYNSQVGTSNSISILRDTKE